MSTGKMRNGSLGSRDGCAEKRVLCVDVDCFSSIGGGQTVYLNLARNFPEYRFFYPSGVAGDVAPLPNVFPVACQSAIEVADFGDLATRHPRWHIYDIEDYVRAVNLARSVRGMQFDVVDVPDYNSFGRFLRFAFEVEGVQVGRFVQALHGRVSETYLCEWFKIGTKPNAYDWARQRAEDLSLRSLDGRYGLSPRYVAKLQADSSLAFTTVDPLLCVSIPALHELPAFAQTVTPRAVFVGRLERRKGADLFAQLLWDLGPEVARRALVVGSDLRLGGISGRTKLLEHLRARGIEPEYREGMSRSELAAEVFHRPSVVVLPSRMDQFNLIALEALLHACPVMVGEGAGASSFLPARFPGLPLAVFREAAWDVAADDLREMLRDYHSIRERILELLHASSPVPERSGLAEVYAAEPSFSAEARQICRREFDAIRRLETMCVRGGGSASSMLPEVAPQAPGLPRYAQLHRIDDLPDLRRFVADTLRAMDRPADTQEALDAKRARLCALVKASPFLFRTHLLIELADIEERFGNALVAAAYRARVLRWLNGDRFDLLPQVGRQLRMEGMDQEAVAVSMQAACERSPDGHDAIFRYLVDRYESLRVLRLDDSPVCEFERRRSNSYRVSVIVSYYQVPADRFSHFMRLLSRVEMVRRHEAEIVLMDSGSQQPLWELNGEEIRNSDLEIAVYRTPRRETIQQTWNRCIGHSRGEYLAFLGTDEALRPDALDLLASCLDRDSSTDWAMGDSFIAGVRDDGALVADKLAYIRTGMTHASLLFDCTYLSYVGGLYRRSVHDRFGYYDPSFRGAGDTEFKCRLHPFLTFRHIPQTLGMFLDYPSARTTNSAKVELEDSRAWYLFRTLGGIRYLFQGASKERLEEAFWRALANRRCYAPGPESDLALAANILRHVAERFPNSSLLELDRPLAELLGTLEAIGLQTDWSFDGEREFVRRLRASEKAFSWFSRLRPDLSFPSDVTADARFFAHTWLWE